MEEVGGAPGSSYPGSSSSTAPSPSLIGTTLPSLVIMHRRWLPFHPPMGLQRVVTHPLVVLEVVLIHVWRHLPSTLFHWTNRPRRCDGPRSQMFSILPIVLRRVFPTVPVLVIVVILPPNAGQRLVVFHIRFGAPRMGAAPPESCALRPMSPGAMRPSKPSRPLRTSTGLA